MKKKKPTIPSIVDERGFPTPEYISSFPNTVEGWIEKRKALEKLWRQRMRREAELRKKAKEANATKPRGFFTEEDLQRSQWPK